MVVWDRDGDTRHAVGLLGVMPVLLLVGEAGGLACWGVGVVFGNRIVDASIFACLHVEVICAFKAVCVVCGCVFFVL